MPGPVSAGVGVFAGERAREVDGAEAFFQVAVVPVAGALQLLLQRWDGALGEDGDAVFVSFAVAHDNQVLGEIHIFDAQPEAFKQAQPTAIEQLADELIDAGQAGDDLLGFDGGEDGGQLFGLVGPGDVDAADVLIENVAIEEEEGGEGLVLRGRGDVVIGGQVGEEGFDFGRAHLGGMAFLVEEDVAFDPAEVGFFGAQGVMVEAGAFAGLVEQFGGAGDSHEPS